MSTGLERLADIEARIGLRAAEPKRPVAFRRLGRWLLDPRFLNGALLSLGRKRRPEIPNLAQTRTRRLWQARLRGARMPINSTACAVLLKSNLRAFYLGPDPQSIKIAAEGRNAGLQNEIETRRRLADAKLLDVPALRGSDVSGSFAFLSEALIEGRPLRGARDAHLIGREVLPRLWTMYQYFGISPARCGDVFPLDGIAGAIEGFTEINSEDDNGWKSELIGALGRLRACQDEAVPVALGHGDLSPDNMILARDGRVFIADWEMAGSIPLLWDCRKLLIRVPGAAASLRKLYKGSLDAIGRESLDLDAQTALAGIRQVAVRIGRIQRGETDSRREMRALRSEIAWARQAIREGLIP